MAFFPFIKWDAEEGSNQCYLIHAGHHMACYRHAIKQTSHFQFTDVKWESGATPHKGFLFTALTDERTRAAAPVSGSNVLVTSLQKCLVYPTTGGDRSKGDYL